MERRKGGRAVSVSYTTADVTAAAGSDYTAKSGSLSLSNGGCRCGTISVPILGDGMSEGTETFVVNLTNPVDASISKTVNVPLLNDTLNEVDETLRS